MVLKVYSKSPQIPQWAKFNSSSYSNVYNVSKNQLEEPVPSCRLLTAPQQISLGAAVQCVCVCMLAKQHSCTCSDSDTSLPV